MRTRAPCIIAILFVWIMGTAHATRAAAEPTTRPVPAIERAVVISIDGCRPDVLLRAKTPNVHHLMETGSYSFWARTTALAITLPSHTSMLTGLVPRRHEIEWNIDLPLMHPVYPKGQTLFEVAKRAGYTTAMAAGKSKFSTLAKPGTLDWAYVPESTTSEDPEVVDHAVEMIADHKPQVLFVHLPSTDNVGHAVGWGTHAQIAAVEQADAQIGRLVDALREAEVLDHTFILVTADHGGAGRSHGPDDARSRHIPWIANGPGIRKDLDLTTYPKLEINTEDTFATVCYLLAIRRDPTIDGKPIAQIVETSDLMHVAK